MQANSRPAKLETLRQTQQAGLQTLSAAVIWGLILIPVLLLGLVVLSLRRLGLLGPALVGALKVIGLLLLILADCLHAGSAGLSPGRPKAMG
jgi:hypothetical protein